MTGTKQCSTDAACTIHLCNKVPPQKPLENTPYPAITAKSFTGKDPLLNITAHMSPK